jgi:hypothetical protein
VIGPTGAEIRPFKGLGKNLFYKLPFELSCYNSFQILAEIRPFYELPFGERFPYFFLHFPYFNDAKSTNVTKAKANSLKPVKISFQKYDNLKFHIDKHVSDHFVGRPLITCTAICFSICTAICTTTSTSICTAICTATQNL